MAIKFGDGPTRCLLVRPSFLTDGTFYSLRDVFKLTGAKSAAPALGLLILPTLLPEHWEFVHIDEDIDELTDDLLRWADIVMVSGIGPQLETMTTVIRRARSFDKIVVVGGSGPTLQPHMYEEANFIVVGEAEGTVPKLLEDLRNGVTKGIYQGTNDCDLTEAKIPRYDLCRVGDYMFMGVNFCRGCPFTCEFCAQIEIFGRKPRTKTVQQMINELQTLYDLGFRGMLDFGYDNLIGDQQMAIDVLRAMARWLRAHNHPFYFSTEATVNIAQKPEILELMRQCDFRVIFVGFESADPEVLAQTSKGQNTVQPPAEVAKILNSYGMIVNTGLILGFDSGTPKTSSNILHMIQETGAFPALVLPLHALPNTGLSRRLEKEGRLFAGGELRIDRDDRTDTATTGLNFVTARPRTEILKDLAEMLAQLYDPELFYSRLERTIEQFEPDYKFKPTVGDMAGMIRAFTIIARTTGLQKSTRRKFWRLLTKTLVRKPAAIEMMVGQAVLHTNYANRSDSYINALNDEIATVKRMGGEDAFNTHMLGKPPVTEPLPKPPKPRRKARAAAPA